MCSLVGIGRAECTFEAAIGASKGRSRSGLDECFKDTHSARARAQTSKF